ncbi:MAG: ABC transporter ATP-binding protein [Nitrospinae bacterium]|nr:ABC transporter ATP-binding protein [Nitrospinota bacterium]MBF0634034.1 ABC transporter ATP-binding protein [Nitrospinota bacterium]
MNQGIVTLQDVTKIYKTGNVEARALAGVSASIEAREFSTLCGPSGSGKTTLLNLIGGLDSPTSGKVWLEGKDLSALTRSELAGLRRDRIGFIFQAYNLIPTLTAIENAEFVLFLQNYPKKERRERAMLTLKEVGLDGLENRKPHEMSGGQQQRVAIARAIAHGPAIVLADEPTSNVDSATADSLLELMEKLNHENGVTFLFSTHDQRVINRAHRIIEIRDGGVVSDKLTALAGAR